MPRKTENYEIEIALEWGFNEYLINNRYSEIIDAASFLKYRGGSVEPIKLFKIRTDNRDDLKVITRIILEETRGWNYLTFSVNGLFKRKSKRENGGITELLYRCNPDAVSKEKIDRLALALGSKYACSVERVSDGILLAESETFGTVESVLKAAHEELTFIDKVKTALFARGIRPAYNPRRFCGRFDLTELTVIVNQKRYRTFDLTDPNPQMLENRHSIKDEYARYRRSKGIDSVIDGGEIAGDREPCERDDCGDCDDCDDCGGEGSIYLISDLHLNHADIIRTTARPFADRDIEEMNRVLIENWRRTVKDGDRIIYLGDLTYKADEETADRFLGMLSGNLTFVEGNHDKNVNRDLVGSVSNYTFEYKGYNFYCVHNPKFAPKDFAGWIIHGHTHNTRMCRYPFVNMKERTINVSCEVIGYRPVSIDTIITAIGRCRDEKRERADYPEDIV